MLELTLPYPPSVNSIWRNIVVKGQSRTLLSRKGREYRETVAQACMLQGAAGKRLSGRLEVSVTMNPPDNRVRDVSNILKALEDALTHAGVYEDDSQIDRLMIERGPVVRGGLVGVVIKGVS